MLITVAKSVQFYLQDLESALLLDEQMSHVYDLLWDVVGSPTPRQKNRGQVKRSNFD